MEGNQSEDGEDNWRPSITSSKQKIWRYIDFAHFYSIAQSGELWFRNTSEFPDPYEGVIPDQCIDELEQTMPDPWPTDVGLSTYEILRYSTFANCWHMNDYQSVAMWETYTKKGKEIAIKSTIGDYIDALEQNDINNNVIAGKVEYVDFKSIDDFPVNPISPYFHKRESYDYESEFRAIIRDMSYIIGDPEEDEGVPLVEALQITKEAAPNGLNVPIDINNVIDEIYVSPVASDWLKSLVENIVENSKYIDSETKVTKSELRTSPDHWINEY